MTAVTHPIQGHCECPEGGRCITWGTWTAPAAWCHTDGYPCPTSTGRPAPEMAQAEMAQAEGVLF